MIAENHPYSEDLALINSARKGDQTAFKNIVLKYQDDVARVVIGMLGKTEDANDVGQDVFIRFYKSINQFKGDASLKTYLTRIAMNLSLNRIKQIKNRRLVSLDEKNDDRIAPVQESEKLEMNELLQMALEKLEPDFRSVVTLRLIEGYSTKETAEQLGLPLGTVLSRLSRAQIKLKNTLLKLGWDESS